MKKVSQILWFSALAATSFAQLHADTYTIAADTTMSAADMTSAGWWGANDLYIDNADSHLILGGAETGAVYNLSNLYFSGGTGSSPTSSLAPSFEISANTLSLSGRFQIARQAVGTGNSVGVITISGTGKLVAASGNYNVGESGLAAAMYVKDSGALVLTGSNRTLYIASGVTSTGTLAVSGGTVTVSPNAIIGNGGAGYLDISGGEVSITANSTIAAGANSYGSVKNSGGNLTFGSALYMARGNNSTALVSLSGGNTYVREFNMGGASGALAGLYVGGGNLSIATGIDLGAAAGGTGRLTYAGGVITGGNINLGRQANSTGTALITGNASVTAALIQLGRELNSYGALTVSGGELVGTTLALGMASAATADSMATTSVLVNGGKLTVGTLSLGHSGLSDSQMTVSSGEFTTNFVYISRTAGNQGYLTFEGGKVNLVSNSAQSALQVGSVANATGNFTITGDASVSANLPIYVSAGGSTGRMTISGGELTTSQLALVASSLGGDGHLTVSGGTLTAAELRLGNNGGAAANAHATISGGNVYANTVNVAHANSTSGTLTVSGGQMTVSGNISVGVGASASGKMWISDTASISADQIYVGGGNDADAFLTISGGATSVSHLRMAGRNDATNISGEILMTAGTLTASTVSIGSHGLDNINGTMSVTGGTLNVTDWIHVGIGSATSSNVRGDLSLSGGTISVGSISVANGSASVGHMTISGTADVTAERLNIAHNAGAVGHVTIAGGTFNLGSMRVASNQSGTAAYVTLSSGTVIVQDALFLANNGADTSAYMTVSGGAFTATDIEMAHTTNSTAILNIMGGAVTASGNLKIARGVSGGATLSMTAGSLYVGDTLLVESKGYAQVSGTGTVSVGKFEVQNGGSFSGTLYVGAVSGTPASYVKANALAVQSGAILSGTTVFNGANATFTISGTQGSQGVITMGDLEVAAPVVITIDLSGFAITGEDEIILMSYNSATGLENATLDVVGYDKALWNVTAQWDALNNQLKAIIAIPEPAMGAALLGLLALALVARRRR